MNRVSMFIVLLLCIMVETRRSKHVNYRRTNNKKLNTPPHCTQLTKDTDYPSKFKYNYPVVYIPPTQREAYQQLFCLNPPSVHKAVATVCDWVAPPQVQFTLGDEYMHVVRQDPTGRFLGNAVITTYQYCAHNLNNDTAMVTVTVAG